MTGRYQSKVFNLLSRYSMKLRDQSAQTWRQVRVAAIWSLQIVLYPIYVGYQSSRLVGKQLQQTARQTVPRLRAATQRLLSADPHLLPESDAPIQQTLDIARSLDVHLPDHQPVMLLIESDAPMAERELARVMMQQFEGAELHQPAEESLDLAAVRIRGVASNRATRKLVLVTTRNQSLDLLTPAQADHLARRIVAATALYWRQQRQLRPPGTDRVLVSTYLSSTPVQKNALPPIRLFQQLMAWMQHSPLAQSVDLFQESRLPALPPSMGASNGLDESLQPILRSAQSGWLTAETRFSDWFKQSQRQVSKQLEGLLGYGTFWSVSEPPPIDTAAVPVPPDSASWLDRVDTWLSHLPGLRAQPLLPSQEQLWRSQQPSDSGTSEPSHLQPGVPYAAPQWSQVMPAAHGQGFSGQIWETVDTAALELAIKPAIVQQPSREPGRIQQDGLKQNRLKQDGLKQDGLKQNSLKLSRRATSLPPMHKLDAIDLEHAEVPLSSLDTANQEEAAMMPQSWIETEAQLVRYEKHPLTQLLEWLDQGMLWIEDRVTQLWNWMTHLVK